MGKFVVMSEHQPTDMPVIPYKSPRKKKPFKYSQGIGTPTPRDRPKVAGRSAIISQLPRLLSNSLAQGPLRASIHGFDFLHGNISLAFWITWNRRPSLNPNMGFLQAQMSHPVTLKVWGSPKSHICSCSPVLDKKTLKSLAIQPPKPARKPTNETRARFASIISYAYAVSLKKEIYILLTNLCHCLHYLRPAFSCTLWIKLSKLDS